MGFERGLLQPTDIGLILSYKCQSGCKHCLYNCGPFWREWMEPEEVQQALQMIALWERPPQVHITGGEPFLNFSLLLYAVQAASELSIPRYTETNAGWCLHPDQVAERFRVLRQAGLQAILISCSPFHAESIPPRHTLLAIQMALEIFGQQNVMVYLPDWIEQLFRFGIYETTPLKHYVESYGQDPAGVMLWDGYGLISGGRAGYQLGYLTDRHPASAFRGEDCYQDILFARHSHFDLYGNYISGFCGGLALGDWHELPQILEDASRDIYPQLVSILVNEGPYGLFCLATHDYGYRELPGGYAGKCHLCVDVRRHLWGKDQFSELRPDGFYQAF